MSNALDQSLDDIISSKPRNRGIRKGRRGGALRVNKAAAAAARRPAGNGAGAAAGQQLNQNAQQSATAIFDQGSKIIVSNLVRPRICSPSLFFVEPISRVIHPRALRCCTLSGLCLVSLLFQKLMW